MEDFNIEVKGEAMQIFKVLSKDDHDKMPFQGIEIAKGLQRIPFFARFFDVNSQPFISMCINEKTCQFEENDDIYALSQEKDKFVYIILEGKIRIEGANTKERRLGIFGIFGQTEIIFQLKNRQERAIAATHCKCMKISSQSLKKLFNKTQFTVKCLHYLNVNTYFQNLSIFEKMQIVLKMQKQSFNKGQVIKLEGDELKNIIFIIYGSIQIVKELLINSKVNEYVIDSLEEMSSYGEYQCLHAQTSEVKLKATNSGSYYSINYAQIAKTEHKIIQSIKASAISYPPNEELNFLHNVKATLRKEEKKAKKKLRH